MQLDGDRPGIPYDVLSLDVGITPSASGVPGALQHATPVKPVSKCAAEPCTAQRMRLQAHAWRFPS